MSSLKGQVEKSDIWCLSSGQRGQFNQAGLNLSWDKTSPGADDEEEDGWRRGEWLIIVSLLTVWCGAVRGRGAGSESVPARCKKSQVAKRKRVIPIRGGTTFLLRISFDLIQLRSSLILTQITCAHEWVGVGKAGRMESEE